MTYSENTQRLLATYEALSRRDLDALWRDVADDYRLTDHVQGLTTSTREEAQAWMDMMLSGSSDLVCEVLEVLESDDATVVRVRGTGTHDGDFGGVPATGRRITLEQCEIHRFNDAGQLAEAHIYYDLYGLLAQLGAVPELTSAGS